MRVMLSARTAAMHGGLHAALLVALVLASPAARADAAQDCRSGSPEARIGGCTRLLAEARTPRQRAIALDGRCWAHLERQAFADALSDCNSAVRADDQYPYAFHNRGIAYAGLQNPGAAIADFNRALAMRPTFSNTLINRAKVYVTLGDTGAAIRDYEEVLRLKPENEEARSALAALRGAPEPASMPSAMNSLCGSVGCR
jgi:tetratricopeptide (TPR) repeat protein